MTSTVVITGASSGIGRASAHRLAGRGMNVVLAGRDPATLEDAAMESKARGAASVAAVPTDVTDPRAVEKLAATALETTGALDVWINSAAVMAYGRFENLPRDVYRQVIEVNLFGAIEGSRAALRHFRHTGGGHLINIGSLYAKMSAPFVGPYVVSKYGLLGFTDVLRQEVADEPRIHIGLVLPGSMNTPIFRHAANFTGRRVRPVPPVSDVARVARAVEGMIDRPREQVTVGATHRTFSWAKALFPHLYDRLTPGVMDAAGFEPASAPDGTGNVFDPQPGLNALRGDWSRQGDVAAIGRALRAGGTQIVDLLGRRTG